MADSKISALAAVTTVLDTDEYVVARAGATNKITGANLKAQVIAEATNATQAELDAVAAAAVAKSLYDANTVLAADSDNTPAAVTMNASTILARLAAGNIKAASVAEMGTLLGPSMPGYELAYAERTTDATTTQTTRASATTWLTAPSVTFDGSTAVMIQVCFSALGNSAATGTIVDLWEDTTDLAIILQVQGSATSAVPVAPAFGSFRTTPSAGAKVYTARGWVLGASTGTGFAGTGASIGRTPGYIRITRV